MATTSHEIDYTDSQLDTALDKAMSVPTVTSSDNNKVMMVSSGSWAAVKPVTIYSGTSAPLSNTGANGDIYIQTS